MNFINVIEKIVKSQQIFHSILEGNEAQTRWQLIDTLVLDGWGFDRKDVIVEYSIEQEGRLSRYNKVDYCILLNKEPRLLIEAKSLGVELFDKYSQLKSYFDRIVCEYDYAYQYLIGVLTDGDLYLFFTNTDSQEMDNEPFYSIRLSSSEDFERNKLLAYSKSSLLDVGKKVDLIISDEEYEFNTLYRIDNINSVIDYFKSKDYNVGIDTVSINGVVKRNIKSFKALYKEIIKMVNNLRPSLLFELANNELANANKTISNLQFSLNKISSSDFKYNTNYGIVYISMPNSEKGIIDRIVNLIKISGFGMHNLSLSLKEI